MKKHYAYYSLAFGASLLIHFSTMQGIFRYAPLQEAPKPNPVMRQQVNMQFMDAYKQKEQPPPPDPTPLIGTDNNIAAQPELPDEQVESKNQPYMKKVSESKQIRTQVARPSVAQPPQVLNQSSQPQTEQLDSTDHTEVQKEKKNIVKEDIFEKKDAVVKKNETQLSKKTTETPEEQITKVAKQTPFNVTHSPSPETMPQAGAAQSTVQSPIDGQIDELMHQEKVDQKSVAKLIGHIQFNIAKHNLGEYYSRMKRTISRNWQTRIMLNYSGQMFASKSLIVFQVTEDGSIGFIKIVDSFGNPFFSKDCEAAIIQSAKFEPLPEQYVKSSGKKDLWLFMSFGYNTD